jgi:hypothetical protein
MPTVTPATKTALELIELRATKYIGDARLEPMIDLAEELLGDKLPADSTQREYAKALQVLHWLELSDRANDSDSGAGVGSVTMEKEGELTIKYGNTSSNVMFYTSTMQAEYSQTIWGLELYTFIKRYITPFLTRFTGK